MYSFSGFSENNVEFDELKQKELILSYFPTLTLRARTKFIYLDYNKMLSGLREYSFNKIISSYFRKANNADTKLATKVIQRGITLQIPRQYEQLGKIVIQSKNSAIKAFKNLCILTGSIEGKIDLHGVTHKNKKLSEPEPPMYVKHKDWLKEKLSEGYLEKYPGIAHQAELISQTSRDDADSYLYHQFSIINHICPKCRSRIVKQEQAKTFQCQNSGCKKTY